MVSLPGNQQVHSHDLARVSRFGGSLDLIFLAAGPGNLLAGRRELPRSSAWGARLCESNAKAELRLAPR